MNSRPNLRKPLAVKTIVFIAACLLLQACSDESAEAQPNTSSENGTESSAQPVVAAPDIEILPGELPTSNSLQNTVWKLSTLEREDGSMYSPQPELAYFLTLNADDFRIQFWCVYREGNYTVLNDGVLTTTSLADMQVFDCPPPPIVEPSDVEDVLTGFFDGETIMFLQTESDLELRSVSNESLRFSACETSCSNSF